MTGHDRRLRIAVLTGGISNERSISLASAAHVLSALDPHRYDPYEVVVGTDGLVPDLSAADLVIIAMHGKFAEDGSLQRLLDERSIPYTGSPAEASALGMDKAASHEATAARGIRSPSYFVLAKDAAQPTGLGARIRSEIGFPCFIKPNASGSSIGMSLVEDENGLTDSLRKAFQEDDTLLIQERIEGREFSCAVLGNTGQHTPTALPIAEIVTTSRFFDLEAKYDPTKTREICPAEISPAATQSMQTAAIAIHEALGCAGLTRSDFILAQDGTPYFLEINTIPGMTRESICPKEAAALGWTFSELLDRQIELALGRFQ